MLRRRSYNRDGEEAVLISLATSIGMIILTVVGWWMWKIFARIAEALLPIPPGNAP